MDLHNPIFSQRVSPGLVFMGGDSCSKGSNPSTGYLMDMFSHIFIAKIIMMFVWKDWKLTIKEVGVGPLKKWLVKNIWFLDLRKRRRTLEQRWGCRGRSGSWSQGWWWPFAQPETGSYPGYVLWGPGTVKMMSLFPQSWCFSVLGFHKGD